MSTVASQRSQMDVSHDISSRIGVAISGLRLALSDDDDAVAIIKAVVKVLENAKGWLENPGAMQREDDERFQRILRG